MQAREIWTRIQRQNLIKSFNKMAQVFLLMTEIINFSEQYEMMARELSGDKWTIIGFIVSTYVNTVLMYICY